MNKPTLNIFFVISNITQLLTETFLAEYGSDTKTIVLHTKRFKPDMQGVDLHYYPYFDDRTEFELAGSNFIRKRAQRAEIYQFISEICKDASFEFYAPHFYINTLRMISNHPACLNYYYIEEGTLSYMNYSDILTSMPEIHYNFFQSKGLGFKIRKAYPDFNKEGICLRGNCFPFLSDKVVLSDKSLQTVLQAKESIRNYTYDGSAILVFDSCVENKMAGFNDYLICLFKSIAFIRKQGYQKIYFKFHPDQHLYPLINYYREYLETDTFGIVFEELPGDLSLELVFLKSRNLLVLHTISSLGYYASMQGHTVYSNAGYLLRDKVFREKYFEPVNAEFNFVLLSA